MPAASGCRHKSKRTTLRRAERTEKRGAKMEKKYNWLLVVLTILLLASVFLTACTPKEQRAMDLPTVRGEMAKLEGEEGNWLGLTAEEKLADFDYLYQMLEENYPYFQVLKRMEGVDLTALYQELRPKIGESASDAAYFVLLNQFTDQAQSVGHLSLITPMDYEWFVQTYHNTEGVPENQLSSQKRLAEAYGNPQSQASYRGLSAILQPVMAHVQQYYAQMDPVEEKTAKERPNVETRILEEGRIAYIAINSFDMSYYEEDREKLLQFYQKVRDYEHVIFDLTNNFGGGMRYFDDLIAAPNISETLTCQTYELVKTGALNGQFIDLSRYRPIAELTPLERMNQQDLRELDAFYAQTYTVTPLADEKCLKGRLWLLVGPNVFSSSEYAAMFSKATGFATLVGQRTGGDGIGEDPIPIVLPNSGLIVRYSAIYGITADGTGSQEFGTEPDIYSAEGESALDTCLRLIDQVQKPIEAKIQSTELTHR